MASNIQAKMRDLPYEIWLQIVSYLPDHQVRTLYSVNRPLYSIALDLRHKNVSIGILPDRVIEETKPPILRNPRLSSRPTDLEFTFYDTSNRSGPDVMQRKFLSSLKTFLPSVRTRMGSKPPTAPTVKLAQISDAMPKFTRVTELSFKSVHALYGFRDSDASLIVPQLVGFVGNRLRTLHIQSPFLAYLPPRIESLESFTLEALKPYHTVGFHHLMIEKVPTFIEAHKSTLRDVAFSINTLFEGIKNMRTDISPILQSLRLISCLYSLNLRLPFDVRRHNNAVPLTQVHEILKIHQQHLVSLALTYSDGQPPHIDTWRNGLAWRQEWASVRLPNLKNLTLCLPDMQYNVVDLRQFTHSLVSLKMTHRPLAFFVSDFDRDLLLFCQMLSKFSCLQDLSLHLPYIAIDYLAVFSRTWPHLHSLHIAASISFIHDFVSYEDFSIRKMRQTGTSTIEQTTAFTDWALESLDYSSHGQWSGWVDRQMAIWLPNVVWINERTRTECLSGPISRPREYHDSVELVI